MSLLFFGCVKAATCLSLCERVGERDRTREKEEEEEKGVEEAAVAVAAAHRQAAAGSSLRRIVNSFWAIAIFFLEVSEVTGTVEAPFALLRFADRLGTSVGSCELSNQQ